MKVLAHIRKHDSLSLGSYGQPRMTPSGFGSLKEAGLAVGERRVGRLMKINGIRPVRTRKHKVTTNSNHSLGIAPNLLYGDFAADMPNRKWAGDISYVWTSEGGIFHSDRGSQYCAYDYQKRLQRYGLRQSMSGKRNCYDNAAVETFFKSLKAELLWRQTWPTRRQAEAAIFQYINGFYNARRRHSYLGGISLLAFEAKVA